MAAKVHGTAVSMDSMAIMDSMDSGGKYGVAST